jgi:hypothetical protein
VSRHNVLWLEVLLVDTVHVAVLEHILDEVTLYEFIVVKVNMTFLMSMEDYVVTGVLDNVSHS